MPMVSSAFSDELLKTTDPDNPDFIGFPITPEQVAEGWIRPLREMFDGATNPPVGGLAPILDLAFDAGVAAMAPLVIIPAPQPPPVPPPPLALAALAAGFAAFAVAISLSPPAIAVQAIPPPAPFVPALSPPTSDPVPPAIAIAATALAWAVTGLANPPPVTPPTVPWL